MNTMNQNQQQHSQQQFNCMQCLASFSTQMALNKHKKMLAANYATAMQVKHWTNKSKEEQNNLLQIAKKYNKEL
jgi:hypothetical protein